MQSLKSANSVALRFAAYWRETARHRKMPAGAKAGLTVVAFACLSIGTLSYQAFGPRDIIAHQVAAQAV